MKLIFAGTPDFSVSALTALVDEKYTIAAVLTQPDRPAGRGRKLSPSPVKQYATQNGLDVWQPETLKTPEIQQQLASLDADAMIVAAYGLILPKPVLSIPRLGCLNIHASILPRWRGAAPIQRAILAGDNVSGITIMQMNEGLDTGDILSVFQCPIETCDTGGILHDRLAQLGAKAIITTLADLNDGKITPQPQDDTQATYASKLSKKEANIDWNTSAREIHDKIRGFNPWPVAQTLHEGKTIRLWQSSIVDRSSSDPFGTVIQCDRDGIIVSTPVNCLRIEKLQLPGGKPLPVEAFLNAHSIPAGTRFESPEL